MEHESTDWEKVRLEKVLKMQQKLCTEQNKGCEAVVCSVTSAMLYTNKRQKIILPYKFMIKIQ